MRIWLSVFLALFAINAHADWSRLRTILSKYSTTSTPSSGSNTSTSGNTGSGSAGTPSPAPAPTPQPAPAPAPTPSPSAGSWWQPGPKLSWQIQYTGNFDSSLNVDVYNIDLFDRSAADIKTLHAQGKKVICYFSGGSFEDWRPDAGKFPAAVKGKNLDGWAGEKWLDVRNLSALGPVMTARLDLAKSKGCDGVDPDNMDGYTQNSGFTISYNQQLTYNRYIAQEAHKRGLAVGLKNDLEQVSDLASSFDYAVNESCFDWNECSMLKPFLNAQKPVFQIEYNKTTSQFCSTANQMGMNSIRKKSLLDAYVEFCR